MAACDLLGQRFGQLVVVKRLPPRGKRSAAIWLCLCDCGETHESTSARLRAGVTTRCHRCSSVARGLAIRRTWIGEMPGKYWYGVLRHASVGGKDVGISAEDAYEVFLQQGKRCALTGMPLQFAAERDRDNDTTASLDRIDSSRGYVHGNIQWVHKTVNIMKNALDESWFIQLCCEITDNRGGRE